MSAEWDARDVQPMLLTSTNPCITRADGAQRVKAVCVVYMQSFLIARLVDTTIIVNFILHAL